MLIGLDIGTTNVKAVALSDDGKLVASAERLNQTLSPQPGWSEQEPEAVFQNVLEVLGEVIRQMILSRKAKIRGIVFSSAMHGLVAVDKAGKPLTNFLLWSDLRADAIAKNLWESGQGREIYQRTGVPIHAMSPLCKLIWLRENQPEVFQNAYKFLGIKEFVWHKLTGKFESDLSLASATGLLNIQENNWDDVALALANISMERLPALVDPSAMTQFSDSLQLPESFKLLGSSAYAIPLIIGASDGALANLGSGATEASQSAVTIGTSAAIRMVVGEPVLDEQMRTFCYRLDAQHCIVGGASNNGTNALEWLRTAVFQSPLDAENFANQALAVPPGSEGLLLLPYLHGERAPLYDAQARASFQGLTARHMQAHFVRAAMEGILFNLKLIAEALEDREPIRTLHAGGGFSHNRLWVQMLADIFQKPVLLHESGVDASVLGAVKLGREVLNLKKIPEPISKLVQPNAENALAYAAAFEQFKSLASNFE